MFDETADRARGIPMLFDDTTGRYLGPATEEQCSAAAKFKRRVTWIDANGAVTTSQAGGRKVRVENHPSAPTAPEPVARAASALSDDYEYRYTARRFLQDASEWVQGVLILLAMGLIALFVMWLTGEGIFTCSPQGECR